MTSHPDNVSCGGFAWNQAAVTPGNMVGGCFFALVYWYATYSKTEQATDGGVAIQLEDSSQDEIADEGEIERLTSPLQQMIPQSQAIADEGKIKELASPSQQLIPQSQLYAQKYIIAAEICVKELTQWCDQLSAVLTHLRSRTNVIGFDEFSEILTQLQLQRDAQSPIYLKDALIRKLAEDTCPDFEKYARGKGTIKYLSTADIIPADARKRITEFLQLCSKVETTVLKVKNPANYGSDLSAGQYILTEAIFELNELRFELNESFAALSYS